MLFLVLLSPLEAATSLRLHLASASVSGYQKANTSLGPGLQTSVTNSSDSGTKIQWTATGGGSAIKWISDPLSSAVTISGTVTFQGWAKEDSNFCNCGLRYIVIRYTGGAEGATVVDSSRGTELTTSITTQSWTASPTSTAFSAGDRIVIYGYLTNVGTMAGSHSITEDYDGGTAGSDGESFVSFTESLAFNAEPFLVSTTSSTGTFPLTVRSTTAGNLIVAVVDATVTPASVDMTGGVGANLPLQGACLIGATGNHECIYAVANSPSGGTAITCTTCGTVSSNHEYEFSGVVTTTPFDTSATCSTASSPPSCTVTYTPHYSAEALVTKWTCSSAAGNFNGSSVTWSDQTFPAGEAGADFITSTFTAVTATVDTVCGTDTSGIIAGFKGANGTAASVCAQSIALLGVGCK